MINSVVPDVISFRESLFSCFDYRADATMDTIDALAGTPFKESVIKISLSPLFRRKHDTINDVVGCLFEQKIKQQVTQEAIVNGTQKVTALLAEQCQISDRGFALFAVDCTPNPRIFSKKLEDRGFVHKATKIPGQAPITIGHQYSCVVYLPKRGPADHHWVVPLSVQRVKTTDDAISIGMRQVIEITQLKSFKSKLCLLVGDTAYSRAKCSEVLPENVVSATRVRNNSTFYHFPKATSELASRRRGRPSVYGAAWKLSDPGTPDDVSIIHRKTKAGRLYTLKIEAWRFRLDKGESRDGKASPIVFDAIRITVLKEDGSPLYKKALWLMLRGEKRGELSLEDIADAYLQRFDIEHFFRFGKQKLLMDAFQTPDVRHEENWWWLCFISYAMLYKTRKLADYSRYPWEKRAQDMAPGQEKSPAQTQRAYERIIKEIGTPAQAPKSRGKSPGRAVGDIVTTRPDQPVVKKSALTPKNEAKASKNEERAVA
jgi:hypothetical protein